MKCNDAAGGGKASDTVVHDVSRTRHRSSSISHAFGFSQPRIPLRFFRSSGRCVSIPLQLFGLFALASIHHRRLDLDEPSPSPSPPSSLGFRKKRKKRRNHDDQSRPTDRFCPSEIGADVNRPNGSPRFSPNKYRDAQKRLSRERRMQMEAPFLWSGTPNKVIAR